MARYVGLPTLTNIFEPVERGNQQCPIFFFFFVRGASKKPCWPFLRFTTDCVGGGWRTTLVTRP